MESEESSLRTLLRSRRYYSLNSGFTVCLFLPFLFFPPSFIDPFSFFSLVLLLDRKHLSFHNAHLVDLLASERAVRCSVVSLCIYASSKMVSYAFREIVKVGPLGIAPGALGRTEASTTRRLSTPLTRNLESTQ